MQIKRFEAKNMAEAFRDIKQEFGPDAVILSAKTLRQERGLFDLIRPARVEVMAATDNFAVKPGKTAAQKQAIKHYSQKYADNSGESHNSGSADNYSPVYQDNKNKNKLLQSIQKKFQPIKNNKNLKNNEIPSIQKDIYVLNELKKHLRRHGVENEIVKEIIENLHERQTKKKQETREDLRSNFLHVLEDIGVEVSSRKSIQNRQNVIAMIGLTGVGKTTTLVKLAASHILEKAKSVGVISLDTHRVASNALLKVYADIIGFPVRVATNNKEIKSALNIFKDKELILIDTPGIGLKDEKQKYEIKAFLDQINPDEILLLIPANVKRKDAGEITKRFELLKFDALVFTKMDETSTYGIILNQLVETLKPISYITTGQNIPEDIKKAGLETMADLLLDTGKNFVASYGEDLLGNEGLLNRGLNGIGHN